MVNDGKRRRGGRYDDDTGIYENGAADGGSGVDEADGDGEDSEDGGIGGKSVKPVSVIREVLDWAKHFAIAIVIGILFINFVGQRTVVYGASMTPTLEDGDQLFIDKFTPRFGTIKRGDIVTIYVRGLLEEGKDNLIKRVIAVEGDTVEILDGIVYVNGEALDEGYIRGDYTYGERLSGPVTLGEGQVFVMGDNRTKGGSNDSRSLGAFEVGAIKGRAFFRWYPFSKAGTLH